VASSQFDLLTLSGFARNTDLFISQLVDWKSEYRVFVCNSEIIGIKHYKGENETGLDLEVVKNAIELFKYKYSFRKKKNAKIKNIPPHKIIRREDTSLIIFLFI
jgi:hypothetical protein